MIAEIFLGLIAIGELVAFAFYVREQKEKENKYINALLSKDASELTNLTFADKTEIKPNVNPNPDIVAVENMSDEEFDDHIKEQLEEQNG